MSKNWIKGAITHPGSLRASAKKRGLIKGGQKLSQSDLETLDGAAKKTGNTRLARRVGLAETLGHLRP